MIDLKFTDWDCSITENDIDFQNGAAEVSQNSRLRLQIIEGEQFDDIRIGLPWLTDMVSTLVGIEEKRDIVRKILLNTEGVKTIDKIRLTADLTGVGAIYFEGTTENNEFFSGGINA